MNRQDTKPGRSIDTLYPHPAYPGCIYSIVYETRDGWGIYCDGWGIFSKSGRGDVSFIVFDPSGNSQTEFPTFADALLWLGESGVAE